MTKEERKARKAEKQRKRLEKILSKPNRPTVFIVLFAFAALFLALFVVTIIGTFSVPDSMVKNAQGDGAAVIGVIFALIIFYALFILFDLIFGGLTALFTALGLWRLIVFLKRKKLKLEHPVTDSSDIDNIIDLDLTKEDKDEKK